jgi:glycine cleavage system H protein
VVYVKRIRFSGKQTGLCAPGKKGKNGAETRHHKEFNEQKCSLIKEKKKMKEISELNLPDNIRYAEDHEWARLDGNKVTVGLDDYAQDQLGDIVFVELPKVGDTFKQGEEFATVESVKAVCECYLPVGGEIVAVNGQLEESPELMNESPYENGWMVEVNPSDASEVDSLMTSVQCLEKLKGAQ